MQRESFNRFRNYVTLRIRNAKKSYYERKFDECKRDIKGTWDLIHRIVRPGNFHRSNSISELTVSDNTQVDPCSISDLLDVHFSNVSRRVAESCPTVPRHFADWLQGD